ncbi:MAG: 30S ribosomal protein S15 [Thermoplasmata archaeon]
MSRIHSSKKGRAGSKKSLYKTNPSWVKMKSDEIEEFIVTEFRKGTPPSQIGAILRDQYGVPSIKLATGMKLYSILKKRNIDISIPEDLASLINNHKNVAEHLRKNRYDLSNKRGYDLIHSKIKRLVKYYKRKGVLNGKWSYNPPIVQ